MSKPIIVGHDATSSDHAPLRFSVAGARCVGAPLIVVCVYASGAARDRLGAGQVDEDLVRDATAALEDVAHELAADDIRVEYRGLEGQHAARALHETAKVGQGGLVVVGSTRRGSGGRVLPGSLVERLMHGAPCPIAVVPYGWEAGMRFKTIAWPSSTARRDATRCEALTRSPGAGATLRVLTAVRASFAVYGDTEALVGGQHGQDVDALEGVLRAQAEAVQRAAITALGDDVAVETDAVVADPAGALIRASEHLDLLVCGSRGYGPLRAALLGAVSRRIATEARLSGDRAAPRGGVLARRAAGAVRPAPRRRGSQGARGRAVGGRSPTGSRSWARFARVLGSHLGPRLIVGIVTALGQGRMTPVAGGQQSALAVRLLAGWLG